MNFYRSLFVLAAALLAAGCSSDQSSAPLQEAASAGMFTLGSPALLADRPMPDISGKDLSLSSARGENGLLVIFPCNTCPWVQAWEDRYLKLAEQCRERGIGMIAVNSNEGFRDGVDSMDEMKARAAQMGYTFPYVIDKNSELADAFGATRTPDVFLFDKSMILVYRGAIDDNARNPEAVTGRFLSDAIGALSAGKDIAIKETKSIGCSIKRL